MTGVELIGALASDYLAASGFVLSSVGGLATGHLLETLMRKRAEAAKEILVEELRYGSRSVYEIDAEEAVAVIHRFFRAATEGAARLNLGLMGACVAGGVSADRLHADLFLRWADILASLRREEVHLLAVCKAVPFTVEQEDTGWNEVRRLMTESFGYTEHETSAYAASVSRTGCLAPLSAFDGMCYTPTPLFDEMASLVDIDGVIRRYPPT